MRTLASVLALLVLAACAGPDRPAPAPPPATDLYPGETPAMRRLVQRAATDLDIPEALLHRVIQRESDYRADARNGPYWGLMQILPQTARTMGFAGPDTDLLNPEINLRYAGRYLRGAWIVADHDMDRAVGYYARGYYYEARDRCLLVETGLLDHEVNRRCR
ncbi:MAG: lytic transglycosylase domain-containing protein [Rhodobacter sp.]|uniref:lytic transglycosylase domain-containing protein n=1 Tax=Pararhodobacter sp. TaxID=2127056 RepID=UPI001D2C4F6E|nr:lytic transglycosylase domain-containing protein [Pararhodobacter sp.]MCB1344365.1 lytic transglycosylase domain-containing protein [Paracoccaceae bacterium]MCC0074644.1 lytic transglycosylase domain-containing protein [Rhodobacter sp.]HPD92925.1 lytic transglycosylase domain-containing protein [Pararhodobacter sp.]